MRLQISESGKKDVSFKLCIAICVLFTLAAFVIAYHFLGGPIFPNDDAFIALHNARVLWLGHDTAYRGVPALVGATSGAHLALLMLFESFINDDATALYILCAVVAGVYVLGLLWMSINVGCSRIEATLIAVAGLVLDGSIFQLLNGLDTGLAMAAVVWTIKLLTDRERTLWLPLLCSAMPFVRPELIFLSAASMWIMLADHKLPTDFKMRAVVLCTVGATPFLLWYWIDTGLPVPSTVGAKTYFFAERHVAWWAKLAKISGTVALVVLVTLPLCACARFIRHRELGLVLLLFVVLFFGSFFWSFPSGLTHNAGRYLFPFMPVILFGVASGLSSLGTTYRKSTLIYIAISILFIPLGIARQFLTYRVGVTGYHNSLVDMAQWMNANLAAGSVVMVHDAGYIAYAGHFPLIDLAGLKTPAAIDVHKALTYPSAGELRPKAVAKIADLFKPSHLLVVQRWDDDYRFTDGLRAWGWMVSELYASNLSSDTPVSEAYHLYLLKPPDH